MKGTVALLLIVISMVAAEAPRPRVQLARQINTPQQQQQQQQQPYMPSGWRPNGQQFNLPLKYGPPPSLATEQPEPEQTTTDVPTTTESSFQQQKAVRGELRENPDDVEVLPEQPQQQQPQQPVQPQQQFFVLLPSTPTQNLLYTTTPQQAQKLIVAPQQQQQQQFVTPARLQLTTVFTPFSASYVQILQ